MSFQQAPLNVNEAMVDERRRPSKTFIEWITSALVTPVETAAQRLAAVSVSGQSASIGTTAIPTAALTAGLYLVSYYARITQAGTVSSSLTVTLHWTESTLALTVTGAAMTGNTTTTVQSGTHLVRIDASSPVSYSTTYASVGATAMQYRLDVVLERVAA